MNLDFCAGKNIVVFGLGKAGMSTVKALSTSGANVVASDDLDASIEKLKAENFINVKVSEIDAIDWNLVDFLVLSPGVAFTNPEPHAIVRAAKRAGCPIICDIELLYIANKHLNFIGITGTNGKSTSTALIGHILNSSGIESAVGGNIGIPALELDQSSSYVIEMSSYQLDLIIETKFNISVWLNISADHLDRHGDIEGYVKAKKHIFDNQGGDDTAVVGVDDSYSARVFEELKRGGKIGNLVAISTEKILDHGVSIVDGFIYDNINSSRKIKLSNYKVLQGKHNYQNIAAAYVVAKFSGVDEEGFLSALKSFEGLPHRMQYVVEKEGVVYINDSKATNAEAASKALGTFENIYWIAGGVAKEGGIEILEEFFPKIKHAYLIGRAKDEFALTLNGNVEFTKHADLEEAFKAAKKDAENNRKDKPVVLLSPACASFDQWPNFEARGDAFCKMV